MKELIDKIKHFETNNNLSITVEIHGDYSGMIKEFWQEEEIIEFKTEKELYEILENVNLLKENGRCVSPIQITHP